MAGFNGSGTYVRSYNWVNDKTNGIDITASRFDTEDSGFATGLSTVICKDGQTTTTAVIPFSLGLSFPTGTAGAPSLSLIGDSSTGIYQDSTGNIAFTSLGTKKAAITSTGIVLSGTASGSATIKVAATAGTVNFQLPTTNGTNGQLMQTDGSGNTSWVSVSSGSGTVNSGTSGNLAYYATSTNAVSGNTQVKISGGALTIGTATSQLGTLLLSGSTSGTTTLTPNVTATGTLTLPAATDTLVGKATTDTLTNKTLDTAGTGNVFKIAGTQISSISGNTSKVATTSGSLTSGHLASFDSSGNIIDGGAASIPTALGVGSIIFATNNSGGTITANSTTAAANIAISGWGASTGVPFATGDTITGTWKALQTLTGSGSQAGLWIRTV